MKSKKITILLIVLIVLILLTGGSFAYLYFGTDLLKSNQELFAKYGNETFTNLSKFIDDEKLNSYLEKKNTTPYENDGKINIQINGNNQNVNADVLKITGKVDISKSSIEENMELVYADNITFPVNYLQTQDKFAISSSEVVNKYIAIENKNLKEFASKLGMVNANIPDSIEVESINNLKITQQEFETLKNKYYDIITAKLTKENFTKEDSVTTGYVLTISGDQLKEIENQILLTLKDDEIINDKLNSASINGFQSSIDKQIAENNKKDYSDKYIKITVYKTLNNNCNIKFETIDSAITISCNNNNSSTITIKDNSEDSEVKTSTIDIKKENSSDNIKYTVTYEDSESKDVIKLSLEYTGVSSEKVSEVYKISFITDSVEKNIIYNNSTNFKSDIKITELTDDNSVVINTYSAEEISGLLQSIIMQVASVNTQKNQQLSSSNNSLMAVMNAFMSNNANVAEESASSLSTTKTKTFNQQFESYLGNNVDGITAKAMITEVKNNNSYQTETNTLVTVNGKTSEEELTALAGTINLTGTYNVTAEYDSATGFIKDISIN